MIELSRAAVLALLRSVGRWCETTTDADQRARFRALIEEDQLVALDDSLRPDRRARYRLTVDATRAPVLQYGDTIELQDATSTQIRLKITAIRRVPVFGVAQYDAMEID